MYSLTWQRFGDKWGGWIMGLRGGLSVAFAGVSEDIEPKNPEEMGESELPRGRPINCGSYCGVGEGIIYTHRTGYPAGNLGPIPLASHDKPIPLAFVHTSALHHHFSQLQVAPSQRRCSFITIPSPFFFSPSPFKATLRKSLSGLDNTK